MWYVIQVLAGEEQNVCEKCRISPLSEFCKDVFVPRYVCMKKYQGEWKKECKVLFPGYLFVDTGQADRVEEVLREFNRIAKPVCVGSEVVPIRLQEQEFLEELMDGAHVIQMSAGNIINGQFDIYDGPLQKQADCLRRVDRHKRIAELEISLLGEKKKMLVGLEIVKKLTIERTSA